MTARDSMRAYDENDTDIALTMWLRLVTFAAADQSLFKRIIASELHVLQPLLPDKTNARSPFSHLSHPNPNPNSYPNITLTLNLTLT